MAGPRGRKGAKVDPAKMDQVRDIISWPALLRVEFVPHATRDHHD